VDLTRIDGIDIMTAQTIVAELGTDFTGWKSEAHFASSLGLTPSRDISGGKVVKQESRKVKNRVRRRASYGCKFTDTQSELPRSPLPFSTYPARSS
jgi:transposase